MDCTIVYHDEERTKDIIRKDTGAIVETLPMTGEDRQRMLDDAEEATESLCLSCTNQDDCKVEHSEDALITECSEYETKETEEAPEAA